MELTKSQKRLLIFLSLVLIYFVYDIITDWDTYAGFYGGKKKTVQTQKKKNKNLPEKASVKTREQSYLAGWGRNPFYEKPTPKKVVSKKTKKKRINLHLYAVSMKDNNSVALINDRVVKIGDMISGFTLEKIEKKQVRLSDGKKTVVLKLDTY